MLTFDAMKTKLVEEKAVLEAELSQFGVLADKASGNWEPIPDADPSGSQADENDRADRLEEYGERSATVARLEERLADVNAAIARIDNGTYGICKITNEPIEAERLEANPAADTCIAHRDL